MASLLSFYVLGKDIQRGISFVQKNAPNKNESLLKLATKASSKGYFKEANQIVSILDKNLKAKDSPELFADFKLFQFDLYQQTHKPKKMLAIANEFPGIKFSDNQREDAVRKLSDTVGAKQVILKKDFSKEHQSYSPVVLNEIISYFSILAQINTKEKAQYEFYQAETYYSIERYKDALSKYKETLDSYDKKKSEIDLRRESMDAIFSCLSTISFSKKEEKIELKYAYHKYLSYWNNDKKAQSIYPRLFNIYLSEKAYKEASIALNQYILQFKSDSIKQKELHIFYLDQIITDKDTDRISVAIKRMSKGFLDYTKADIKKSEQILANILFNRYQKLSQSGNSKAALAGYQTVHSTTQYPKSVRADAAFNMAMIYTQIDKHTNALKWYKKSMPLYTKDQKTKKRVFLEKMAKRTALLHNFIAASKMEKFILRNYCSDKDKNLISFQNAILNDLANDYIRKTLYTMKTYKKC